MCVGPRSLASFASLVTATVLASRTAHALDKQGSAHGGHISGESEGTNVSGSLTLGSSIYNPSYAARPDNTGLALFRYAAHADIDLIGRRLSIPIDINMFTDRTRPGFDVVKPTELDLIGGVTSTWPVGAGALELGTRIEHDAPIDQGTYTQTYMDVRSRYLFSLAQWWPDLERHSLDITGWATLGAFIVNPTYAARPDNSGKALLRYAVHTELSLFDHLLSLGVDATMFTDREASAVVPSELDLTPEAILHVEPFEFHLAYERDMPVDRSGFVQTYVYALVGWGFDFQHAPDPAAARTEERCP